MKETSLLATGNRKCIMGKWTSLLATGNRKCIMGKWTSLLATGNRKCIMGKWTRLLATGNRKCIMGKWISFLSSCSFKFIFVIVTWYFVEFFVAFLSWWNLRKVSYDKISFFFWNPFITTFFILEIANIYSSSWELTSFYCEKFGLDKI